MRRKAQELKNAAVSILPASIDLREICVSIIIGDFADVASREVATGLAAKIPHLLPAKFFQKSLGCVTSTDNANWALRDRVESLRM